MTQYLGLSQKEAQKNRVEYGDNLLEGGQKKSALKILLAQFGDLMTLILLCSTILSMAMGEKVEAMTIIAIVILNALMGFFQEYRTERSLQKLGELAAPSATVIRDGHSRVIPAKEVTIGDLVVLKAGDRVPADCRIVENSELSIDESLLTGESVPVEKGCTDHRTNDYSEQVCAFMGTIVLRGHGKAVVYRIGEETRMGEIAVMLDSIEQQQTPLQEKAGPAGQEHCNRMSCYLRAGFGRRNPARRAGDGDAHYRHLSGSGSYPGGFACHCHHCTGTFGQSDGQKECGDSAAARGGNARLCQCNLLG